MAATLQVYFLVFRYETLNSENMFLLHTEFTVDPKVQMCFITRLRKFGRLSPSRVILFLVDFRKIW